MKIKWVFILGLAGFSYVCSSQAAVPDGDLPLSAQMAVNEMNQAIQQARAKAISKLKAAMKNEMQAGNLTRANRINAEIEKISDESEAKITGEENDDLIVGKWMRRDGVTCVFDKNHQVVIPENGWRGPWKFEKKKLVVTLNMIGSKQAPTTQVFIYDLPVKKESGGKKVTVLRADDDNKTLYQE